MGLDGTLLTHFGIPELPGFADLLPGLLFDQVSQEQSGAAHQENHGGEGDVFAETCSIQTLCNQDTQSDTHSKQAQTKGHADAVLGFYKNRGVLTLLNERHALPVAGVEKQVRYKGNGSESAEHGKKRNHIFGHGR